MKKKKICEIYKIHFKNFYIVMLLKQQLVRIFIYYVLLHILSYYKIYKILVEAYIYTSSMASILEHNHHISTIRNLVFK